MKLSTMVLNCLIGLFTFITPLSAEYIVFKKGTPPTAITDPTEYKKIYDILMNYQWPMVIGYASHMSQAELQELGAPKAGAEETFLRKKLQALNATYDLVFIPTIIYELFVLSQFAKFISEREREGIHPDLLALNDLLQEQSHYSVNYLNIKRLMENPTTLQALYDLYRQTNSLPVTLNAHLRTNALLIEFIQQFERNTNWIITLNNKQQHLAQAFAAAMHFSANDDNNYLTSPVVLKTFINFEQEAYRKNTAILYRGSSLKGIYVVGTPTSPKTKEPIDISFLTIIGKADPTFAELKEIFENHQKSITFTPWQEGRPLGSISYGNSLLGGFVYDEVSCAATYYSPTRYKKLGYTLFINKQQALQGKLNSLFSYVPFNTLVSLFAKGTFFHPRTVSYVGQVIPLTRIPGILDRTLPFDKAGLFLRLGNPLQKAYELSAYIGQHAHILKLPDGTFSPTAAQTQQYYTAQREVTEMFKGMSIIKKSLSQKNKKSNPEQRLVNAAIYNNTTTAKGLLNAKISPNVAINGTTVLMGTAALDNNQVLDLLISASADLNTVAAEPDQETALTVAITLGNYQQAEKLLEAGADPNVVTKTNRTALDVAIKLQEEDPALSQKMQALLLKYNAQRYRQLQGLLLK